MEAEHLQLDKIVPALEIVFVLQIGQGEKLYFFLLFELLLSWSFFSE